MTPRPISRDAIASKKEKVVIRKKIIKTERTKKVKIKRGQEFDAVEIRRKCLDCEFVTNNLLEWRCHLDQKHNSQKPQSMLFLCTQCDFQTATKSCVTRHSKTLHDSTRKKDLKCIICDFYANDMEGFIAHLRVVHEIMAKYMPTEEKKKKDGNIVFNCKNCDFVTRRFHRIKLHMKQRHGVGDKIACEVCGILCTDLPYHMYKQHRIKCERCGKLYAEKNIENQYCRSEINGYTLTCAICDKSFKTVHIMNEHRKIMHELPEENHICNICGKDFPLLNRLRVHMKTHVEKVQCHHCLKDFSPVYLEDHIKQQHEPMSLDFNCEICGKGFTDKHKLNKHMMNVHLKLRPYKCRYGCEFGYNELSNRNSHERKKHGKIFTTRREEKHNAILALNTENILL